MDTEKQRYNRRNDARLTKNGNARSEQLLVMPTESLRSLQVVSRFVVHRLHQFQQIHFLANFYCACANAFPTPFVLRETSWVKTVSFLILVVDCWIQVLGLRLILHNICDSFQQLSPSNWSIQWIFVVMFNKWNHDIMSKPACLLTWETQKPYYHLGWPNQQRVAARREWCQESSWVDGTLKAWLVFRYEISDLFLPETTM